MNNLEYTGLDEKHVKELKASLAWLFIPEELRRKTREKINNRLKLNDKIALLMAFIGIITNIISSILYINYETKLGKYN